MPKKNLFRKTDFSNYGNKRRKSASLSQDSSPSSSVLDKLKEGSEESCYVHCLISSPDGVTAVDENDNVFIVKDFCPARKDLADFKYVQVTRKPVQFIAEQYEWVYSCSCNPDALSLAETISKTLNMSYEDWCRTCPACLHVSALKHYLDEVLESPENLNETQGNDFKKEIQEFVLISCNCIFVYKEEGTWGVVQIQPGTMTCTQCYGSTNCPHSRQILSSFEEESCPDFVADMIEEIYNNERCTDNSNSNYKPKCESYNSIPFSTNNNFASYVLGGTTTHSNNDSMLHFKATNEVSTCLHCHKGRILDGEEKELLLYTQYNQLKVTVTNGVTYGCNCGHISFDGSSFGILNMGLFLIGHDILRDYMYHFLHGRMPMHTYYKVWCAHHKDAGHESMLSYYKFRHSWYNFLQNLEIDDEQFSCSICKNAPEIVHFDGVAFAFRKSYVPKDVKEGLNALKRGNVKSGFTERVFIENKKCRDLLLRYCDEKRPLTTTCLQELKQMIQSTCLLPVIDWMEKEYGPCQTAPEIFRPFLRDLASTSPVCALLIPDEETKDLIDTAKNSDIRKNGEKLAKLQQKVPFIFRLIGKLPPSESSSLPIEFIPLLDKLWEKASTYTESNINIATGSYPVTENEFVEKLSFFPSLPKLCNRGAFPADKGTNRYTCRKLGRPHHVLLPGVVTMHCQHGICYGFQTMLQVESPDTVFTILRTRFSKAPETVIYDFACGLHSYALNRDPEFFKLSKFFIDRYHQCNHKACSSGYNISLYPQYRGINTSISEQTNSSLGRIKAHLSYMTPENFLLHSKLFLWFQNRNKKLKFAQQQ